MPKVDGKSSTIFYHDWFKAFEKMANEDVGAIVKALYLLDIEGIEADFEAGSINDIIYSQFAATVRRNREKYIESCEKKSEAAKKREAEKAQLCTYLHNYDDKDSVSVSDKDNDKDKDSVSECSAPQHIIDYFKNQKFKSDPHKFYLYNQSRGKDLDKLPPKQWQALAELWEKKEKPPDKKQGWDMHERDNRKLYAQIERGRL